VCIFSLLALRFCRSNTVEVMATSRRSCFLHHPDIFYYICGEYTLKGIRKPISELVKRAYVGYFGVKLGDQDKPWAPSIVCKTCTEHLRQWKNGK
jgi:hypothetical protein